MTKPASLIACLLSSLALNATELLEKNPITLETWEPLKKEGNQFAIQTESDIVIMLHTLFPTEAGAKKTGESKRFSEARDKAEVLARLLILLKEAPLRLVTQEESDAGDDDGKLWPYALATTLGHGQRILIEAPKMKVEQLLSWLFTGKDGSKNPDFVKKRSVSSHGVKYDKEKKKIIEIKREKLDQVSSAATGALQKITGTGQHHLYINMPWGGLGEIGPDGLLNGTAGKRYDPKTKKLDDDTKLGHFYVYNDDVEGTGVALIGVETCSPGSGNPFGVKHDISSGMNDLTKNRSVNGGSKWAVLLSDADVPASYGGMRALCDKKVLEIADKEWKRFKKMPFDMQVEYMMGLLGNDVKGDEPKTPKTPSGEKSSGKHGKKKNSD